MYSENLLTVMEMVLLPIEKDVIPTWCVLVSLLLSWPLALATCSSFSFHRHGLHFRALGSLHGKLNGREMVRI